MYVFVHIFISTLNVMFSFLFNFNDMFLFFGWEGGRNKHTVLYYALNGLPSCFVVEGKGTNNI